MILRQPVTLTGCGRTDAGVHARRFVAHMDADGEWSPERIAYQVNAVLPSDIAVLEILPASPTAIRDFPTGDQLALAVDVYDNKAATPHRVEIRTSLTADNGTVVYSAKDERRSEELKGTNGTYGHVANVPLKGIAPGRYVLKVEAQSLLSNGPTASREIEISVH